MRPFRMALLGFGHFGRVHALRARAQGAFDLLCVVDPDPEARQAAQACGLHTVPSLHALPEGIEVASVVVPGPEHAGVTVALMQRGIHVLVEKPFAPSLPDIEAMLAAQHTSGASTPTCTSRSSQARPGICTSRAAVAPHSVPKPWCST